MKVKDAQNCEIWCRLCYFMAFGAKYGPCAYEVLAILDIEVEPGREGLVTMAIGLLASGWVIGTVSSGRIYAHVGYYPFSLWLEPLMCSAAEGFA